VSSLAYPFDTPERDPNPPTIADPEPDDEDDDRVKPFDVVQYIRARRRVQRARRRWYAVKWFLLGITAGVVAFSVALEVAT
jgi:hypothetical protein